MSLFRHEFGSLLCILSTADLGGRLPKFEMARLKEVDY